MGAGAVKAAFHFMSESRGLGVLAAFSCSVCDVASVIAPQNDDFLLQSTGRPDIGNSFILFLSKTHRRLVPECWKSARPSFGNSLTMLFVGNPHALPLLNFFAGNPFIASFPSALVKSNPPSRKFGSLSPHLKTSADP